MRTPNGSVDAGNMRDAFVPAPLLASAALQAQAEAEALEQLAQLAFVGQLLGLALRSGDVLSLAMPPLVWKLLVRAAPRPLLSAWRAACVRERSAVPRAPWPCGERLTKLTLVLQVADAPSLADIRDIDLLACRAVDRIADVGAARARVCVVHVRVCVRECVSVCCSLSSAVSCTQTNRPRAVLCCVRRAFS